MATTKSKARAPDRKTEVLSIRIDPRVKFGLDLLARLQRRSTTGVVEWAIQSLFDKEYVAGDRTVEDLLNLTWRHNEVERIVSLALVQPQLLTYEESAIYKVLNDTPDFWAKGKMRTFDSFRWRAILPSWGFIEPVIKDRANASIVRGLTRAEVEALGVPAIAVANAAKEPYDLDDIPF